MVTEAQKRANAAYRKKSVKQLTMRFYPSDEDEAMYAWLKSRENTTEYLKALVRADMGKGGHGREGEKPAAMPKRPLESRCPGIRGFSKSRGFSFSRQFPSDI